MTRVDLIRFWAVLALSLGACSGAPAAPSAPTPRQASQALRQASYFAVGTVGVAGTLSDEEKALQAVLQQPEAAQLLLDLLEDPHTTSEGRLYALLGLRHLELASRTRVALGADNTLEPQPTLREKVQQFFSKFRAAAGEVDVLRGCSILAQPIADVADAIDQGRVRLSPASSISQQRR